MDRWRSPNVKVLTCLVFIWAILAVPTNSENRRSAQLAKGLIVTTPRVWLAGSQEKTCITPHALTFDIRVTISLISKYNKQLLINKSASVPPNESTCIEIEVPSVVAGSTADFVVTAKPANDTESYNFSKFAEVTVKTPTHMTFIQTDKPQYKPGDMVKIRIMTLKGPDLMLLNDDISLVYIEDPSRTRVMQWANISTVKGLGSLEMQLSDEPRLGEWTVKAFIQGKAESQMFSVEEYVLPKYEVTIQHPSYIYYKADNVTWTACARYTYGQPVGGSVKSKVCVRQEFVAHKEHPCYQFNSTKLKDGCAEFSVSSAFLSLEKKRWGGQLLFYAEVHEHGTDVKLNATFTAKVETTIFKLEFSESNSDHYKPGLPYYGQGRLTYQDESPAKGKTVKVKTTARRIDLGSALVQEFDLTTDGNGIFRYILPRDITGQHIELISQEAIIRAVKEEQEQRQNRHLKPWYSPSNSFLQIEPFESIASCQNTISLPVVFVTEKLISSPSFHFQVVARGDVVHIGQVLAAADEVLLNNKTYEYKFNVTFLVTHLMSGSLKILVFTIVSNGETVADSTMVSVEKCFPNQVTMAFADQQKQPGHSTTLMLSADPDSLCSVLVVDKSVKLMTAKDSSVSQSKVFEMLNQYNIPHQQRGYDRHRSKEDCGSLVDRHSHRYRRMIMYPNFIESKYIDSKAAFTDVGVIVLSDLTVVTKPCYQNIPVYHALPMSRPIYVRRNEGVAHAQGVMPEPMFERTLSTLEEKPQKGSPVLHRNFFPESWLWQLNFVGDTGKEQIRLNVPHTITEWVGNGFCTNTQTGLGVSHPFSIKAFQPFFVSFTVPYSVIRGERVAIRVSVFNYLTQCLKVTLFVQKSSAFELKNGLPMSELEVCGHKTETHTYNIIPQELGYINFTIRASSVATDEVETNSVDAREVTTAEDIVTQKLLVEAEGKEEEQTRSTYACAPSEGTFSIVLPDASIVPGSMRAHTIVIGDVMGPTLTGLESLLALPTGCGEQNMLKFSPNIFIMQYLQKTNSLSEEIKSKATEYLQTGYQRELTYRHADGSYSAFGESDKEGSIWLTAFVIKSFAQAKPFIHIDQIDLDKSIRWITSVQLENGCFPEVGRVLHKEMKGGLANDKDSLAALTAYIVVALMEAGMSSEDPVIVRAIQCLNIQTVQDLYTQSLLGYAYTMYNLNNTKRTEIMQALEEKADVIDGLRYWKMSSENELSTSPASIEMTSYVLLSILYGAKEDIIVEANPIVKWLSAQRNAQGGFLSTQDTVIALQALAQYAALVYSENFDAHVRITGNAWDHSAVVTNDNRLLLQKNEGKTLPSELHYNINGTGCVLIQASVKYNTLSYQSDEEPAFVLTAEVHRQKSNSCKERTLKICTRYNGADNASNMAVVSVKMVSGWIPDKDSIKKLMNTAKLRLKRHEVDKNVVQLYFEELDKVERCLLFNVHQTVVVTKTKPVLVHVYDYYRPSLSTYSKYSITSTCGTKEEIRESGNEALEAGNWTINQMRIKPALPTPRTAAIKNPSSNLPKKPKQLNCPQCNLSNAKEIKQKYCSGTHVYETLVVNQKTMTIQTHMHSKVNVTKNVSYRLPQACKCKSLGNRRGVPVVLVMTKAINLKRNQVMVKLENNTAIIESSKIMSLVQESASRSTTVCP